MTIVLRNRVYDELPTALMRCPSCHLGTLTWDGRSAWRCLGGRGNDGDSCRHGLGLSAIFDGHDMETRLCTSQVDLSRERLTEYALTLLSTGALSLPWINPVELRRRQSELESHLEDDEALTVHDALMREAPLPYWEQDTAWRLPEPDDLPPTACSVPGCDRPIRARHLCRIHYRRSREHDSPHDVRRRGRPRR